VRELLPPGVQGLMLAAMLAALASTLDTHLNWGASYWTNDLYRRFVCERWLGRAPTDRALVRVARLSTFGTLAVALGAMTQLGSIQAAWHASLLLGAGCGPMLVLRWVWWRVTAWGEIAAIAASLVLAPLLMVLLPDQEAARLLWTALGATVAGVGVSLAFEREPMERLRTFYLRARPPGFWGPVAALAGGDGRGDARRLGRGLAATALASLSVFSLLTGIGTWLIGSPAPAWFPARGCWIGSLVAIGLALVPVWWRLGLGAPVERSPRASPAAGS
jgi:hypothetical protein